MALQVSIIYKLYAFNDGLFTTEIDRFLFYFSFCPFNTVEIEKSSIYNTADN